MSQTTGLTLIGLGAIGRAIVQRTRDWPDFSVRHEVVTPRSVQAAREWLGPSVQVVTAGSSSRASEVQRVTVDGLIAPACVVSGVRAHDVGDAVVLVKHAHGVRPHRHRQ
mgnify:CR=1 FL=1